MTNVEVIINTEKEVRYRLGAFVEYFEAIQLGEYPESRPYLRPFEEVLLVRAKEALEEEGCATLRSDGGEA